MENQEIKTLENSEFVLTVRNKRIEKGYNLRNFCKSMSFDVIYWSQIERGVTYPPEYLKVYEIAQFLNLSLDKLNKDFNDCFNYPLRVDETKGVNPFAVHKFKLDTEEKFKQFLDTINKKTEVKELYLK